MNTINIFKKVLKVRGFSKNLTAEWKRTFKKMANPIENAFPNARDEMEIAIPVPWGHIAGKAWNDTNGLRVLFVHGLQDNAGSFDRLIPLLPKSFYCIAIDLPGHGKSSHMPKGLPLRVFDYTIAIDRVVDFLGWDKFIYVGHSMGGHVGYYYSSIFNERVSKFVSLDSVVVGQSIEEGVEAIVKSYRAQKAIEERMEFGKAPEYSYKGAIQRLMEGRPDPISEKAARTLAKRSLVKHGSGYRFSMDQRLKAYERHRLSEEQVIALLSRMKCPLLHIMTSETSRMSFVAEDFVSIQAKLRENMRESYSHHIIEGYHSVHMDYPERMSDLIIKFLGNSKCQL